MLWIALAQTTDVFSGGGGWFGAGLLGMVLAWIFLKHLPDLIKRDERKDELNRLHVAGLMSDWKSSLKQVLEHCDRETKELATAFKEEIRRIECGYEEGRRQSHDDKRRSE